MGEGKTIYFKGERRGGGLGTTWLNAHPSNVSAGKFTSHEDKSVPLLLIN